ncbi:MAG: ribonuclease PH [Bdellovibrionota bacterium]
MRNDGRQKNQLRKVKITPNVAESAEGSALVEFGKTRVLCTATYEAKAPSWLLGTGKGWVTAEYGMLPRSTHQRIKRDKAANGGRTQEISRLIGRSLRSSVNLAGLGEKQIIVDCDVLNADGGTRTASVTGGFVALALALKKLHGFAEIKTLPLIRYVSAISVGLQGNEMLLDLDYDEDSSISTDMNFVMTNEGTFVEVQGTAEDTPFQKDHLFQMMELARQGCEQLFVAQAEIVGSIFPLKK